ncbi:actin-related protein 5-like isoform X1 [Oncorhynchus tshawytscha]|uniref:actin-related protein 5-like isoform X1 n=1 Tax=Oncorhynchus tshawytscha TaxID=74940 RepID=UPI000D0A3920|nr:actin-related protein 5-like isoform X1 [Oncorhynchus tshawytscha]
MQRGLTTVGAPRLLFKSLAARNRGTARSESQIRNDISNLEPLRWLIKSWFDRNVVVNFEIQELMFFSHLGDGADGSEEHPIVLTEAPCNPLHSRQMMSVLLFECYRVPNAVVGDSSKSESHPVKYYFSKSWMHVNVGRSQVVSYFQRLLQLKYTGHLAAVTLCLIESCSTNTATQPITTTKSWTLLCQGSGRRGDCGGDAGETCPAAAQATGNKRLAQGGDAAAGPRASG